MNEELQRLRVVIEADTTALKQGVKEAEKVVDDLAKSSEQAAQAVNKSLNSSNLSGLKQQLVDEKVKLSELKDQATQAKNELNKLSKALEKAKGILGDYGLKPEQITTELAPEIGGVEDAKAKLAEATASYEAQKIKVTELEIQIKSAEGAMDAYSEAVKRAKKETDTLQSPVKEVQSINKEIDKTNEKVKEVKNTSKGSLFGDGWAGLTKRIIVLRALRAILSSITNAIKEGIQYLVVYDQKLGDICGYNKTLSQLATNFEKLKVSVSVTAMTLLQTLAPALNTLMEAATWVVERINELFAVLSGKNTYTAANPEYWKDYASYVKEFNSKLRETKTLISGFDEINTISPSSSLFETDNPLTIEKETNAVGALLGAGALGGLLGLLPKLINLFKNKNKALGEQTTATEKETQTVKSLVPQYALAAAGALGLAGALGKLWEKLKQGAESPAWQPDFSGFKQAIEDIENAWDSFKQRVDVGFEVQAPNLQAVTDAFDKLVDYIPGVVYSLNNAWRIFPAYLEVTMQNLVNSMPQWMTQLGESIGTFPNTVTQMMEDLISVIPEWKKEAEDYVLAFTTATVGAYVAMQAQVQSAFENVKTNISSFVDGTATQVAQWCTNTSNNVSLATSSIATNVYNAFQNASTNVAAWVNNTSTNIAKWATNASKNIADGAKSMVKSVSSWVSTTASLIFSWAKKALSWIGAVSVAQGKSKTNDNITNSGSSGSLSTGQIAAIAAAAVAVAAIALIPFTGGASAVFAAFKNGGVVSKPTLALTGEYSGASSNPEIITPENKMKSVMDSSNSELASIYVQVGRQIIQAIENKDMSVSIGDMEIGRACARANTQQKRMTGKALI